jgi:kinetochor protein Mis14/NSL1
MQSEHRKIELQSPSDLAYLTSQIRTAARQKLDLHLPAQPSDSADDLRAQTEVLVDAFVAQVLAGLRNNITINGLDVVAQSRGGGFGDGDEMEGVVAEGVQGVEEEEFEAFDEKLRVKLAKEVEKRDKLVASISKHRRETAKKSARAFEERFEQEQKAAEEQRRVELEKARDLDEEDALDIQIARDDEIRKNWERAVEGLGRLNKGLPETRARLERCGDVVGYLGGEKK